eukprot:859833-Rhodomonas_salina.1
MCIRDRPTPPPDPSCSCTLLEQLPHVPPLALQKSSFSLCALLAPSSSHPAVTPGVKIRGLYSKMVMELPRLKDGAIASWAE